MKEWCIMHPYLTFMLIGFLILIVGEIIESMLKVINNKTELRINELELNKKNNSEVK